MARESQACASNLAPVQLAGASTEAAEENPDRSHVAATRPDEERRVELGFCA
jgi:hypothetical protein